MTTAAPPCRIRWWSSRASGAARAEHTEEIREDDSAHHPDADPCAEPVVVVPGCLPERIDVRAREGQPGPREPAERDDLPTPDGIAVDGHLPEGHRPAAAPDLQARVRRQRAG